MSISLNNSRDQISFSWSGNLSDNATFTDLTTGASVEITPSSKWTSSYYSPLAIATGARNIWGDRNWGRTGEYYIVASRHTGSKVKWEFFNKTDGSYHSWNNALLTSISSGTNAAGKGFEEYFLMDFDGNDLINDYSYYVISPTLEITEGQTDSITILEKET